MTLSSENSLLDTLDDQYWMQQALQQAQEAFAADEVPVGAVVVYQGQCIAQGCNSPVATHDPTAHAEINALRLAAQKLGNYRLQGCTVYVTLEPCAMCAMAMLHARVGRVVFGATDPKTGSAGSVVNLFSIAQLNHQTQVCSGVLEQECAALLKQFFAKKRIKTKIPLRDDALRTHEQAFSFGKLGQGHYVQNDDALMGLRLHYHNYQVQDAQAQTLLCIHDAQGFSEQYSDSLSQMKAFGYSILLPDLIGFGRSDKPKKQHWHTPTKHAQVLLALLQTVYVHQHVKILLPLQLSALLAPLHDLYEKQGANTFERHIYFEVHLIKKLPSVPQEIINSPYPDAGHQAGVKALQRWDTQENIKAVKASSSIRLFMHDTLAQCLMHLGESAS